MKVKHEDFYESFLHGSQKNMKTIYYFYNNKIDRPVW